MRRGEACVPSVLQVGAAMLLLDRDTQLTSLAHVHRDVVVDDQHSKDRTSGIFINQCQHFCFIVCY
jgi:hypothetical protein